MAHASSKDGNCSKIALSTLSFEDIKCSSKDLNLAGSDYQYKWKQGYPFSSYINDNPSELIFVALALKKWSLNLQNTFELNLNIFLKNCSTTPSQSS